MKSFSDLDDDFGEEEQLQRRAPQTAAATKAVRKQDGSDVFEDDFGDEVPSERENSPPVESRSPSPVRRPAPRKSPDSAASSARGKKRADSAEMSVSRLQQSGAESASPAPLSSLAVVLARQRALENDFQTASDKLAALRKKHAHRGEQERELQQRQRRILPRSLSGIQRALERELRINEAAVEALVGEGAHLDQQLQQANSPEALNELNQRIAGLNDACKSERGLILRLQAESKRAERRLARHRPEEAGAEIKKLMIEVDLQLQRNCELRAQIERSKLAAAELHARLQKTAQQIEAAGPPAKAPEATGEEKSGAELRARLRKQVEAAEKNLRHKKVFLQKDCQLLEAKNQRFQQLNKELDAILERQGALFAQGADHTRLSGFLRQQPGFSPLSHARKQSARAPHTRDCLPTLKPLVANRTASRVHKGVKVLLESEITYSVRKRTVSRVVPATSAGRHESRTVAAGKPQSTEGSVAAEAETVLEEPAEEAAPRQPSAPRSASPALAQDAPTEAKHSPNADRKTVDDELDELLTKPEAAQRPEAAPAAAPDAFDFLN